MKIRLLKDLPGAKVGTITESHDEPPYSISVFGHLTYETEQLIKEGFAEEIKEEPKSIWDLKYLDKYYVILGDKSIVEHIYDGDDDDIQWRKYNDVFLTQEEAEMELLRREARAKVLRPKNGGVYWYYGNLGPEEETFSYRNTTDQMYYYNGNCHKTKEEAIEWGKKYGKAFNLN